jgi:hypothetical protein
MKRIFHAGLQKQDDTCINKTKFTLITYSEEGLVPPCIYKGKNEKPPLMSFGSCALYQILIKFCIATVFANQDCI